MNAKQNPHPALPRILSRRLLLSAALFVRFYYRRADVAGAAASRKPTLFLVSHRSGAVDGLVCTRALGGTPSLVSVQLLRHPLLRLLCDGIPVLRDKDRERYGAGSGSFPPPVAAAVAQIRSGGSLCLYPEGTSEWRHRPQPYHSGMGVIAAKLKAAGSDFAVQPVGLFYSRPDGFCSRVSIVLGEAFEPQADGVKGLQAELAAALDAVSVCCATPAAFNTAQNAAWQAVQYGADYGTAFLAAQRQGSAAEAAGAAPPAPARQWAKALFAIGFPVVAAAALAAGSRADGRNTVALWRLAGGSAGMVFQAACYLVLLFWQPSAACVLLAAGTAGRLFYPEPAPVPLDESETDGSAAQKAA